MHTYHIGCSGLVISDSGESGQSILVHIDPEWIAGGHHHVYPQVKLEPINYKRLWVESKSTSILFSAKRIRVVRLCESSMSREAWSNSIS